MMFKSLGLLIGLLAASSCYAYGLADGDAPRIEDIQLIIVKLKFDHTTEVVSAPMGSVEECKEAEQIARDIAKQSFDVIDIGTICVKSEFDPTMKPRA